MLDVLCYLLLILSAQNTEPAAMYRGGEDRDGLGRILMPVMLSFFIWMMLRVTYPPVTMANRITPMLHTSVMLPS